MIPPKANRHLRAVTPVSGLDPKFDKRNGLVDVLALSRNPKKLMIQLEDFQITSKDPDQLRLFANLKTSILAVTRARICVRRGDKKRMESSETEEEQIDMLLVCLNVDGTRPLAMIMGVNPQSLTDYGFFHENMDVRGAFSISRAGKGGDNDRVFVKPATKREIQALKTESLDTKAFTTLWPPVKLSEPHDEPKPKRRFDPKETRVYSARPRVSMDPPPDSKFDKALADCPSDPASAPIPLEPAKPAVVKHDIIVVDNEPPAEHKEKKPPEPRRVPNVEITLLGGISTNYRPKISKGPGPDEIKKWEREARALDITRTSAMLGVLYKSIRRKNPLSEALFELRRSIGIAAQRNNGHPFWIQAGNVRQEGRDATTEMRNWLVSMRRLLSGHSGEARESVAKLVRLGAFLASNRRYVPEVGYAVSIKGSGVYNRNDYLVNKNPPGWKIFGLSEGLSGHLSLLNTADSIRYLSKRMDKMPAGGRDLVEACLLNEVIGEPNGLSLSRLSFAASKNLNTNVLYDVGEGPALFADMDDIEKVILVNEPDTDESGMLMPELKQAKANGWHVEASPEVITHGGRMMLLSSGARNSLPDLGEVLPELVDDPVISGEILAQRILLNRLKEMVAPLDSTIIISE